MLCEKSKIIFNIYRQPDDRRSLKRVVLSLSLFIISLTAAIFGFLYHLMWLYIPLIPILSFICIRIFALHHDCSHLALFQRRFANRIVGAILGIINFIPHYYWMYDHNSYHKSTNILAKNRIWGVDVLTVQEYNQLTNFKKFIYRITHNPFLFVGTGGLIYFLIKLRFYNSKTHAHLSKNRIYKLRLSIYLTNLTLFLIYGIFIYFFGLLAFLVLIIFPFWLTSMVGIVLFYIQHNLNTKHFIPEHHETHTNIKPLIGSYFKLPHILRWFTANIGFYHIHRFHPKIPYYNLLRCMREIEEFQKPNTITIKDLPELLTLPLYDTQSQRLVSFRKANQLLANNELENLTKQKTRRGYSVNINEAEPD